MLYYTPMNRLLCQILAAVALAVVPCPASHAAAPSTPVDLRILAINDFHRNLRPPAGATRITHPDDQPKKTAVSARCAQYPAAPATPLRRVQKYPMFSSRRNP